MSDWQSHLWPDELAEYKRERAAADECRAKAREHTARWKRIFQRGVIRAWRDRGGKPKEQPRLIPYHGRETRA